MAPASKAEGLARGRTAAKAEAGANTTTQDPVVRKDAGKNDANLGLVRARYRIHTSPPTFALFLPDLFEAFFAVGPESRRSRPRQPSDPVRAMHARPMNRQGCWLTETHPHSATFRSRRTRFSQPQPRNFAALPVALTGARTRRRRAPTRARRATRVRTVRTVRARMHRRVSPVATPARATRPASPAPGKIRTPRPRSRPRMPRLRRRRRRSSSRRTASPNYHVPKEPWLARDAPARRRSSATTTTTT